MIRRNIFHVVLALDLSRKESARFLADSVIPASQRMGLRWGVVPVVDPTEPELSSQLSRMFLHVYDSLGAEGAGRFLHRTVATGDMRAQRVDLDVARKEFIAVLSPVEERDAIDRVLDSIKAGAHAAARMNSAGRGRIVWALISPKLRAAASLSTAKASPSRPRSTSSSGRSCRISYKRCCL